MEPYHASKHCLPTTFTTALTTLFANYPQISDMFATSHGSAYQPYTLDYYRWDKQRLAGSRKEQNPSLEEPVRC